MFCPQCKAEYRQGFTRCADCDVDLVYALEASGVPETDARKLSAQVEGLRVIWKGHDESECVSLCRDLMKKDIPYKVAQIREERVQMRVVWRYEIGVLDADYEQAKELLAIEGAFGDGGESAEQALSEEEEPDDAQSLPPDDSPPDKEIRNDAYFEPWYPEDAIVEIWSQDGEDISAGIQAALKENLIHCRVDLHNGVHKVFVLPEDAERSGQIVCEIIEGGPLEPRP
jgi:hypothetical protein